MAEPEKNSAHSAGPGNGSVEGIRVTAHFITPEDRNADEVILTRKTMTDRASAVGYGTMRQDRIACPEYAGKALATTRW
jgi:hypothetical protein